MISSSCLESNVHDSNKIPTTICEKELIPKLCNLFYTFGWMTGTGGALSIEHKSSGQIFMTPSGIQKDQLSSKDILICDCEGNILDSCSKFHASPLKLTSCWPLFLSAHQHFDAQTCFHSHSQNSVLVTLLDPQSTEFSITGFEMLKGIRKGIRGDFYRNDELLIVPIIENKPFEVDLKESLYEAMKMYPETCCVLVRGHGYFLWADSWQQMKTMAECFEYLFELVLKMKQYSLDSLKQKL